MVTSPSIVVTRKLLKSETNAGILKFSLCFVWLWSANPLRVRCVLLAPSAYTIRNALFVKEVLRESLFMLLGELSRAVRLV